jgi:Uma2 family endonuclease
MKPSTAVAVAVPPPPKTRTPSRRTRFPEPPELTGVLTVNLRSVLDFSNDDVLMAIARDNEHLRLEVDAEGDLVIMAPVRTVGSNRNQELSGQLWAWARQNGTGRVFDSSVGFRLGKAVRGPDASWVRLDRLRAAAAAYGDKDGFFEVCPEFVAEMRSQSDRLRDLDKKMREYLECGAQLGWLIDPISEQPGAQIYRPNQDVEKLDRPATLSGDPVLPGFVLDLAPIWEPGF